MSESMFMKPADVALLLQVSRPHVMKLARAKVDPLPIIWLNRAPRFERASVMAWLKRQQQKGAA